MPGIQCMSVNNHSGHCTWIFGRRRRSKNRRNKLLNLIKANYACDDYSFSVNSKRIEKIQSLCDLHRTLTSKPNVSISCNDGRRTRLRTSEELTKNGGKNARGQWWTEQNTGKFATPDIECAARHGPTIVADQFPRERMATLRSPPRDDYGVFPVDEIQLFGGNICGRNWARKIENDATPIGGEIGNDFQEKIPYAQRCTDTGESIVRKLTNESMECIHSPHGEQANGMGSMNCASKRSDTCGFHFTWTHSQTHNFIRSYLQFYWIKTKGKPKSFQTKNFSHQSPASTHPGSHTQYVCTYTLVRLIRINCAL